MATKAHTANMRTGPSSRYPIKFVYHQQFMVFRIDGTFEDWYKVTDFYGDVGWMHRNLFTRKAYASVRGTSLAHGKKGRDGNSRVILVVAEGASLPIIKCIERQCLLGNRKIAAWFEKDVLWGV